MTTHHRLTIKDLSCDLDDRSVLLFRTKQGARGHAAGLFPTRMYDFMLDGIRFHPNADDHAHAEQPVGYELFGEGYLYVTEAV